MKYDKSTLSYDKQAERLLEKGLKTDKDSLVTTLKEISYYRLSAYLFPFKKFKGNKSYYEVTLGEVLNIYSFDRELRFLTLDIIERIEVILRNNIIHLLGMKYGVFSYLNKKTFNFSKQDKFDELLNRIEGETARSKETFKKHFDKQYTEGKSFTQKDKKGVEVTHFYLPIWMLTEVISFGTLLKLFQGMQLEDKKNISEETYCVHPTVLESWLFAISTIRNICAHHSRLWNRTIGFQPKNILKATNQKLKELQDVKRDSIFGNLSILKYMLDSTHRNCTWYQKIDKLLKEYPKTSIKPMGFPKNWKELEIWK